MVLMVDYRPGTACLSSTAALMADSARYMDSLAAPMVDSALCTDSPAAPMVARMDSPAVLMAGSGSRRARPVVLMVGYTPDRRDWKQAELALWDRSRQAV